MKNTFLIVIFVLFAFLPKESLAISAWPGSGGTVIATFSDASGIIWHEERQTFFVIQNTGRLNEINSNGTLVDYWDIAGDLEGITLAENNRYIYIGIENPDSIVEFDLETEALTGKSWDLTTWMTGDPNSGLEAISYRNGYFYAGLQADGKIYVFDVNLNVSGEVDYVETITPYASYTDIAGLDYNSYTGLSYAIFDTANALIELNSSNGEVNHYSGLPGSAQEGIALVTNCMARTADVYIANDDNGQVIKYINYPVTCLDADEDGVDNATDCNDYNASISANQTYYRDSDGDGLGSDTTTSVCSLTAPTGYVTNTNDQNDNDFDNDGSQIGSDCNDSNSVIQQNQTYYQDADNDGLGSDITNSVCSFTVPTGYVTNSNDQNDSDFDNDNASTGTDCNDNDSSLQSNQTYYRDADGDGLGDAATYTQICSLQTPTGYVTSNSDPVDIISDGAQMYINGTNYTFFDTIPNRIKFTNVNFYNDNFHEVIAVGLFKKKAVIVSAKVDNNNVTIVKRGTLKKRYKSISLVTQISKKKFVTKFNGRKKYTWKIKSSGSFKR